jgi:hypothetical protein
LEEVAKLKVVENAAVPEFRAFVLVIVTRVDGSPIVVKVQALVPSSRLSEQGELVDS